MNGATNAGIGATTTEIAAHGFVDIGIGRFFDLGQKCRRSHDLSRLAISALRYALLDPRFLHGMFAIFGQAFDGRNLLAYGLCCRDLATTGCNAVDVDGASAAGPDSATIFRSGQVKNVTQYPQQRHFGVVTIGAFFPIHVQDEVFFFHRSLPFHSKHFTSFGADSISELIEERAQGIPGAAQIVTATDLLRMNTNV